MKIKFKGKKAIEKNSKNQTEKFEVPEDEESLRHYQRKKAWSRRKIEPVFGTNS